MVIAKTKDMDRKDWLMLRKNGIGGSDAGAVCGLNPYVSPLEVYFSKTCEGVDEGAPDNEAMREGRDLEDYVARRFMEASGLKIRRANVMYASREHPFMIADVDRLVTGRENGITGLECKTASPYSAEKWKDGKIPAHYIMQCYHYMAVLDAQSWYIAVMVYGREFKYIKLERDEEIIQQLIRIEENFWNHNVMARVMPEPDGSDAAEAFINRHFAESRKELSIQLKGFDEKLRRREEITGIISQLDTEKKKIEQEIKAYMDEAEYAENENFLVSWKNSITNRIDTKRLKEEMPEIYTKFLNTVKNRKFIVKTVS
ncbi:MAG: YqaJ viral recombinase family protein [Lachnospiraceae bacterium]|nr:YqaJ viral recombinase family protein [Lachnospiraceae bacterium]